MFGRLIRSAMGIFGRSHGRRTSGRPTTRRGASAESQLARAARKRL